MKRKKKIVNAEWDVPWYNVIEKSTVHMDCVRKNLKNVNAWDQKMLISKLRNGSLHLRLAATVRVRGKS